MWLAVTTGTESDEQSTIVNTASRTSSSSTLDLVAAELQEAVAGSDTNSDSLTDISFFVSLVKFLAFL